MSLQFNGSFDDLKSKLEKILSESWDESEANKKVIRQGKAVLNFYPTTGTIQFQGPRIEAEQLERKVSHHLYPTEYEAPTSSKNLISESSTVLPPEKEYTDTESKYLYGDYIDSELFIGIVSTVGTEKIRIITPIKSRLEQYGYKVKEIKVSSLLSQQDQDIRVQSESEYDRIKRLIKEGDKLRESSGDNSILAAGVIKEINSQDRNKIKTAYLIDSLKHPDEVELLRKVYGNGFFLIGIHTDGKRRMSYLMDDKGILEKQAVELIEMDENEVISHGQKTRDTYHLSDFYVSLGKNDDQVKNTIERLLKLLFAHPYLNPTFDEFAMFMAFSSSTRSSDLSRQVGAVITYDQQIIATGANDIPKSGGGQYWATVNQETGEVEDKPGGKDYTLGQDSNKIEQSKMIESIMATVTEKNILAENKDQELREILKSSQISDLTEFGRVVHAEMETLLSCARIGIKTVDTTLYCTTFPCHNCAKHIIDAGVKRVVYVEPYPKSKALELYSDSIDLKTEHDAVSSDSHSIFEPFIGVGARRFLDLFSISLGAGRKLKRKDKQGYTLEWSKNKTGLRVPLIDKSYKEIERAAINKFDNVIKNKN